MADAGRPRDERVDAAIERATRELLVEVGYAKTSMQAIARRAGVAKTSVYRRAPDKPSLIFDVLFGQGSRVSRDGGLGAIVARLSAMFADPVTRSTLAGLFAAFATRPELAEQVRTELLGPAYEAVASELDHPDAVLLTDMMFGAVFVRSLIFDRPVDPHVTETMIALLRSD